MECNRPGRKQLAIPFGRESHLRLGNDWLTPAELEEISRDHIRQTQLCQSFGQCAAPLPFVMLSVIPQLESNIAPLTTPGVSPLAIKVNPATNAPVQSV